jgi:hypothetical protein
MVTADSKLHWQLSTQAFGFNVSFPHIFSVLHPNSVETSLMILTFNTLESVDGREIRAI